MYKGYRQRKKTGLCGENSQVAGPPLPPVWETPVIKKKVGFIFHFRTSGTFLVFTKKSQFLGGECRHQEVGLGQTPTPQFGNFFHIIPFFSDRVPYLHWLNLNWMNCGKGHRLYHFLGSKFCKL